MRRVIFVFIGWSILLVSCTQRMVCPAYQSAFIYDQEALRKRFSYFNEDSTPKVITVSKNRYLMIPEVSYRKKIRSMQTIPMKAVYVKLPDSLTEKKDQFAGAEQDETDSVAAKKKTADDSVYAITKDKEVRILRYDWDSIKYKVKNVTLNADQDNYMWYFRDVLVLPDVRAALEDKKEGKGTSSASGKNSKSKKKEKTGFFGFFKNIFKKKPKEVTPAPADTSRAVTNDSTSGSTPPAKKKKGLFGRFRKNSDVGTKPQDKKKDPAKKEDDGF